MRKDESLKKYCCSPLRFVSPKEQLMIPIQPRKINNNLSLEEVEKLCLYYQNNPKNKTVNCDQYCAQALLAIGVQETGYKYLKTAKKILWKETYKYVSCNYNF